MSSDEPGDAADPEQVSFIHMGPEDTFDSQDRVMSRAAWDLHCRATSHSAFCGHPGFVPDDYLEHLDGLSIETTITAAELCTTGMWERIDGGYRVLDWEAVEICLDRVRETRGEDPLALAWEQEREARFQAQMATTMVVTPPCAVCGIPSAASSSSPPDTCPPSRSNGLVQYRQASCSSASQDSGISCSRALLPTTGMATPSTQARPGGSPRDSVLLCPSPRSTQPDSTTMQDSARTATCPTATSTGTSPRPATATAPTPR